MVIIFGLGYHLKWKTCDNQGGCRIVIQTRFCHSPGKEATVCTPFGNPGSRMWRATQSAEPRRWEWGTGWGILSLQALDCFVANKAPKLTFVYRSLRNQPLVYYIVRRPFRDLIRIDVIWAIIRTFVAVLGKDYCGTFAWLSAFSYSQNANPSCWLQSLSFRRLVL